MKSQETIYRVNELRGMTNRGVAKELQNSDDDVLRHLGQRLSNLQDAYQTALHTIAENSNG